MSPSTASTPGPVAGPALGDPVAGLGLEDLHSTAHGIAENIGRVLVGKPDAVRAALVTLLAEGHLLIEDVPGVGKTSLAKACLLYTSPSPRDRTRSRMPSSA